MHSLKIHIVQTKYTNFICLSSVNKIGENNNRFQSLRAKSMLDFRVEKFETGEYLRSSKGEAWPMRS